MTNWYFGDREYVALMALKFTCHVAFSIFDPFVFDS